MCYECLRLTGQSSQFLNHHGVHSLALEPIETQDLINKSFVDFTKNIIKGDPQITINIHREGGDIEIGGGAFGRQVINSLTVNNEINLFIINTFSRLDSIIDLDFNFSNSFKNADINFYIDREIKIEGSLNILGLALTNNNERKSGWWEILINGPAFNNQNDYLKYAIIHEFGHTLGLEHPFDNSDLDFYSSTNPSLSAYPEQTVMAYRNPISGNWPNWFSDSDLESLVSIWGPELQLFNSEDNLINGNNYSELINGSKGNDTIHGRGGNDRIYGGKDNDWINGNTGDDSLYGNLGNDQVFGGKGNDQMWGGDGNDELFGNLGNDWLDGGAGNDKLTGGKGSDRFRISEGEDWIFDFNTFEGDRLEIEPGSAYSFEKSDGYINFIHKNGITSIAGISDLSFQSIDFV